jgi:hypothetical protein
MMFALKRVLTTAVVAARYFQNHHERGLCILQRLGYISKLSISRFNQLLHQIQVYLHEISMVLGEIFTENKVFIIDTDPVPVCRWVRRKRSKRLQGQSFKAMVLLKRSAIMAGNCICSVTRKVVL